MAPDDEQRQADPRQRRAVFLDHHPRRRARRHRDRADLLAVDDNGRGLGPATAPATAGGPAVPGVRGSVGPSWVNRSSWIRWVPGAVDQEGPAGRGSRPVGSLDHCRGVGDDGQPGPPRPRPSMNPGGSGAGRFEARRPSRSMDHERSMDVADTLADEAIEVQSSDRRSARRTARARRSRRSAARCVPAATRRTVRSARGTADPAPAATPRAAR